MSPGKHPTHNDIPISDDSTTTVAVVSGNDFASGDKILVDSEVRVSFGVPTLTQHTHAGPAPIYMFAQSAMTHTNTPQGDDSRCRCDRKQSNGDARLRQHRKGEPHC